MEDSSSEGWLWGYKSQDTLHPCTQALRSVTGGQQKAHGSVLSWPLDVGGRARAQRRPSSPLQLSFLHIKGCHSALIISLIW